MSFIYLAILLGVCFLRTDFYNLVCCMTGIYFLSFMTDIKKWMIWILLYLVLISFIYDGLWMFAHLIPWWNKMKYDGDVEMKLWKIVIILSFVSIFVRLLVTFVIWKVSVDYSSIVKEEKDIETTEYLSWEGLNTAWRSTVRYLRNSPTKVY